MPEAEIEQTVNPCFPILPLIRTVLEGKITWHPEWRMDIPPDSFILAARNAALIELEVPNDFMDAEFGVESSTENFIAEWNADGRLIQFPVFYGIMQEVPFMAQVRFNQDNEIEKITLSGKHENTLVEESETQTAEQTATEIIIDIEILERNDENASLARIHCDGAYYFVVFQYWNHSASETWYDADGNAQGLLVLDYVKIPALSPYTHSLVLKTEAVAGKLSSRVSYDYDSWGNISRVDTENFGLSVLYNEDSMPRYMEKIAQVENTPSALEDTQWEEQKNDFTFQWDEKKLLVSLKGNFEDNFRTSDEHLDETINEVIAEKRYEYLLDENGNWTERRELLMIRRGNYLFPQEGSIIRRTIHYAQ